MTQQLAGPASLVLSALIARRYYLDGRSKIEIAGEFGLSRFKVARLIDMARSSGLVRIEIGRQGMIDVDLSARIQDRFGLRHAIVVDTPDDQPAPLRQQLGQVTAELLAEIVGPDDVLGLAWARSISAMSRALPRLPAVPVVQLTGALAMPDGDHSSIEVVRDAARAAGGSAFVFYAPFTVPDATTAAALRRQPDVARAFDQRRGSRRLWPGSGSGPRGSPRCSTRRPTPTVTSCAGSGCAPRCRGCSSTRAGSRCRRR